MGNKFHAGAETEKKKAMFKKPVHGVLTCISCLLFGFLIHYFTFYASLSGEVHELNDISLHNAVILNSLKKFSDKERLKAHMTEATAKIFNEKGFAINEAAVSAASVIEVWGKYDIEPSISVAIIDVESHFNPVAVSDAGAVGLMQIMPSTGRFLALSQGMEWYENELCVPQKNIMMGGYYLSCLKKDFEGRVSGNLYHAALTAYNLGPGYVYAHIKKSGDVSSDYSIKVIKQADYYIRERGLL